MGNPFGALKKKSTWGKVLKVALVAADFMPAGSAIGKVARTVKAIHDVETTQTDDPGDVKKAAVLERVGEAAPPVANALSAFIDAYVAVQNAKAKLWAAWDAIKDAVTIVKAG